MPKKNGCKEYPTLGGELLHYPTAGCHWRANVPFEAVMTLSGVSRGRSAATFHFASDDGRQWPMFLHEMEEMMLGATVVKGVVYGWWMVRKRGQNFGIEWLGEEKP